MTARVDERPGLGVPVPAEVMSMTLGQAALAWAGMGWSVFPIVPRGKTPYAAGQFCGRGDDHGCGFLCATADPEPIARWWAEHPDSNIGITSPDATVVDEDRIGALRAAGIELPKCPWAVTGRAGGGRHFFLRAPASWRGLDGDEVKVTYRVAAVEVKGFAKGYVVAAPSIHESGTRYSLEKGGYVPEIPQRALDALVDVADVMRPGSGASITFSEGYALPEGVGEGGRYRAIVRYVAHLYNRGLSVTEMWPLVTSQLAPRFHKRLSDRELRERFDRATKDLETHLGPPRNAPRAPQGPLQDAALTEFDSRPVEWLWPSWLPRGVVTLMDGNPGVSKSTLVADLVARVTTGREWPDGSPGTGVAGRALWVTTEDDPGRVLRPRIEAAGGDAALVRFVTSEVVLPDVADGFRELLVARASEPLGLVLAVLDPLFSHISAKVRSIADAEMRQNVMNPLTAAAEASGISILVVRHFSKDTAASAINRGAGSLGGIVGAARALWTVIHDPDDETGDTKVVGVSKLNYARLPAPRRYRIADRVPPGWVTGSVSGIEWLGEAPVPIDTLIAGGSAPDAVQALEDILAEGPVAAAVAENRMKQRGFTIHQTRTARARLGVRPSKSSMTGGWTWVLPAASGPIFEDAEDAEDGNGPDRPTFEDGTTHLDPSSRARARAQRPGRDSSHPSSRSVPSSGDQDDEPAPKMRKMGAAAPSARDRARTPRAGAPSARVREDTPALTVIDGTAPTGVACHFYADHQSEHFLAKDGSWRCRICTPEEETPA